MSKTIVLQCTITRHYKESEIHQDYRATIQPHQPITTCTIDQQIHPINERGWHYEASGFSYCRPDDEWDRETGCRLALKSALRHVDDDEVRVRFWQLYLTAHPPQERGRAEPLEVPRMSAETKATGIITFAPANGNGKPAPKFKVGDRVRHINFPKWGEGTIKNILFRGAYEPVIIVDFEDGPQDWQLFDQHIKPAEVRA